MRYFKRAALADGQTINESLPLNPPLEGQTEMAQSSISSKSKIDLDPHEWRAIGQPAARRRQRYTGCAAYGLATSLERNGGPPMTLANLLETIGVRAVVVGTIGQLSALKGVLDPITAVPLPTGGIIDQFS